MTEQNEQQSLPAELFQKFQEHFGCDPSQLPVLVRNFQTYERANLHLAIQDALADVEKTSELIGIIVPEHHYTVSLSRLSRHLEEALAELLVAGGPLTRTLLGVSGQGEAGDPPSE